jgi:hypothetical protein
VQDIRLNPTVTDVFQMWTLLERVYFLNQQRTQYVTIFLEEDLSPEEKN